MRITAHQAKDLRARRPIARPITSDPVAAVKRGRPEREALAAILGYLRFVKGIVFFRQNVGAAKFPTPTNQGRTVRFGFPGLSDIQILLSPNGRACFIEVKSGSGRATQSQEVFLELARGVGCVAFIARGVDDVRRVLRESGIRCP